MAGATDRPARRTAFAVGAVGIAAVVIVAAAAGPIAMPLNWRLGARLAPLDWQVQSRAATLAIEAKDGAASVAHALQAILANPLDAKTLTIAGAIRSGPAGTRLLNQSAALGWRDALTNYRLIDQALRERDPVIAAQRVDAVGRTLGAARVGRFADLVLAMPGGVEAMAERAAHHQGAGWMPDWLSTPAKGQNVVSARSALLKRIDSAEGPWKRLMVRSAGVGFEAGGDKSAYFRLWRESVAESKLIEGAVYDGGFTMPLAADAMLGEWQPVANSPLRIEPGSGGGLQLTGADGGGVGNIIAQAGSGRPALTLEARWSGAQELVAATSWRYTCLDNAKAAIASQSVARDGNQWVQRATFRLPVGCQVGALWLDAMRPVTPGLSATLLRVSAD